jgi:hypothetical protein
VPNLAFDAPTILARNRRVVGIGGTPIASDG